MSDPIDPMDCRLVVISCQRRQPIQRIWTLAQRTHWPDCPFPIDMLSPDPDRGWNRNLLDYLDALDPMCIFVLVLLDDHFLDRPPAGESYTANMDAVLCLMRARVDIALVKVQAGNAYAPEIPFVTDDPILRGRLREYDRVNHGCKRTNLVPTLFRRNWLYRLTTDILAVCGRDADQGRNGALRFEQDGTRLTEDASRWPQWMLGIHRPGPDGSGGRSLLSSVASDGVREGRFQKVAYQELMQFVDLLSIDGLEAFL